MVRVLAAYLAAVLVAYGAAATAQTQSVMNHLVAMGMPVTAADRVTATAHDLLGMASVFLPLVAVALAIALPVAAWAIRRLPHWRRIGYPLAGGVALLMIHTLLYQAYGIHGLAASRTTPGLTLQALCGALGGWVFLRALPVRRAPPGQAAGHGETRSPA